MSGLGGIARGLVGGSGGAAGGPSNRLEGLGKSLVGSHASGLLQSVLPKADSLRARTTLLPSGGALGGLKSMAQGHAGPLGGMVKSALGGGGSGLVGMGMNMAKTALKTTPLGMAASAVSHSPIGQAARTGLAQTAKPLQHMMNNPVVGFAASMVPELGVAKGLVQAAAGAASHGGGNAMQYLARPGLNG